MTLEFDVSFQRAVAGVTEYQARLQGLGSEMDRLEQGGKKLASAYKPLFSAIAAETRKAEGALAALTKDQELAGRSAEAMRQHMEKSFAGISNGYLQATVRAEAFRTNLSGLKNVLANTRAEQQYYNTQLQIATALTDAANKADVARARRDVLTTSTGRAQVAEEELLRAQRRRLVEEQRAISMSDAHVRAYREREQAQRQAAQAAAHYAQMLAQATAAQREMAVTGERLAWGYQVLTQRQAELAAQQERARAAVEAHNRAMIEGEQNLHRYTGANGRAAQAARRLADEERRAAESRRSQMDELRRDIEERSRLREQEQQAYARQANQDAIVQQEQRRRQELDRLRRAIEDRYATEEKGRQITERLSRADAQYQARLQRLNQTIERRNALYLEQSRANQVLTSSEARLSDAVRRQTEEYKRRAQYAQMTNMQLLGMSRGVDKLSRDMHLNAQAAAMFRAALGGMNASIGIYTSATVLAASVTYAFAAALRNTVTTGMEFTETMSRAEAVMMTGIDAITTSGRSMEGLEMQVRALGASTIFTATQVSGGLVDLGMAGLSANQALTALKPALDLASIGAIEMSEAADIATNVMTSFKLTASDLSEVVDILAMAVTNSNTTISQLANALSYVGPAAEAAGFDLRDTVAAIELLSNAGIKASRAGTGLRRFMLNIQNPTAKGAEVLERYGIALDDAEGNTRDLMDILGQFNQALHRDGIAPSERMAAIVDLVGVRAASAVSRMVGSVGELGVLRRQLDDVAGAAEEMRQKIEDNLSADWKQVKSAFQDLQLEVFQEFQWHMRETAASMTLFFRQLTEEGPDGISRLDELIASGHRAIDVIKGLGTAFLVFKGFNVLSTMAGASAASLGSLAERMSILNARGNLLQASQFSLAAQLRATGAAAQAHAANIWYANSATERLTASANAGAIALQGLARGAAMVGTALGWAGVVWGIYQAISSAFGGTTGYLEDHQARVEEMEKRYHSLNEEIEKTQHAATQGALETHGESLRTELDGILSMIAHYTQVAANNTDSDLIQVLEDRLFMLRQSAKDTGQALLDNLKAQGELGISQGGLGESRRDLDELVTKISEGQKEAERLRREILGATSDGEWGRLVNELDKVENGLAENRRALREYRREIEEAEQSAIRFTDQLQQALEQQGRELDEKARVDQLSVTEALIEANQRLADIRAEVAEMDAQGTDRSLGVYKLAEERALAAQEEVAELMNKYIELSDTAVESREALNASRRSDKENADLAREALKELNAELLVMQGLANGGAIVDVERMAEIFNLIRQNESTVRSFETSQAREAERAASEARRAAERAAQEEERRIQQQMSAFQSLRAEYDKIGEAVRQYHDQQKSLKSLLDAGRISTQDYDAAIAHLGERMKKAAEDANPLYQTIKKLREELVNHDLSNSFKQRGDLRLLGDDERSIAERNLDEQIREQTFSGLPTAGSGLDASIGGPMGEWAKLKMEEAEMQSAYDRRIELFEQYAAKDLENREHWNQQVTALEQKRVQLGEQMNMQSNIAMINAGEQVMGQMADLFQQGSAIQKVAFAAQKAAAIAQVIMHGQMAAWQARATIPYPKSEAVAAKMTAMAGFSAGIIGAQTLTSLATGNTGGTDYAGMYDKGGHIPSGKWGIVGEYGPEIVKGPANVTGREATARKLGGGNSLTIAPEIHVTVEGGGGGGASHEEASRTGQLIGKQVENQILGILHREMRPNGVLERWKRS